MSLIVGESEGKPSEELRGEGEGVATRLELSQFSMFDDFTLKFQCNLESE